MHHGLGWAAGRFRRAGTFRLQANAETWCTLFPMQHCLQECDQACEGAHKTFLGPATRPRLAGSTKRGPSICIARLDCQHRSDASSSLAADLHSPRLLSQPRWARNGGHRTAMTVAPRKRRVQAQSEWQAPSESGFSQLWPRQGLSSPPRCSEPPAKGMPLRRMTHYWSAPPAPPLAACLTRCQPPPALQPLHLGPALDAVHRGGLQLRGERAEPGAGHAAGGAGGARRSHLPRRRGARASLPARAGWLACCLQGMRAAHMVPAIGWSCCLPHPPTLGMHPLHVTAPLLAPALLLHARWWCWTTLTGASRGTYPAPPPCLHACCSSWRRRSTSKSGCCARGGGSPRVGRLAAWRRLPSSC